MDAARVWITARGTAKLFWSWRDAGIRQFILCGRHVDEICALSAERQKLAVDFFHSKRRFGKAAAQKRGLIRFFSFDVLDICRIYRAS